MGTTMNAAHYLDTDAYRLMLARIIATLADPGHDLQTTLVEILGDAGIWPDYCRPEHRPLRPAARVVRAPRSAPVSSVISLANIKAA